MSRRRKLLWHGAASGALALAFLPAPAAAASAPPARPNIVFILADDLGARDLGIYGSTFHETPHLDQLAARGVRFTQAYTASGVCSPTRASLLTGRYPARLGITDWLPGRRPQAGDRLVAPPLPAQLPADLTTFAELFRTAGYRTGFFGKWHLGDTPEALPDRRGFDLNVAGSGKGTPPSYFSPYRLPHLEDGPPDEHLDERLTQEAITFMRQSTAQGRPFLVYLSHYAVHTPLQGRPEAVEKYREKLADLPLAEKDFIDDPDDGRVRVRQSHPVYAAMVESLDASVGALLSELDRLGLAENTLVVFTSDNGGLATSEGWPTANHPLRAGKGWAYEGGVRTPLLVAWPGHLPAGATSDALVTSPDFFPTLLELAGLPLAPALHLDGESFAGALRGDASPTTRTLFWHYPHYSNQRGRPHSALRSGAWKLIEWLEDGRLELFHLETDPGESRDVSTLEPDRTHALHRQLAEWRVSVGARMPRAHAESGSGR